MKNHAQEAPKKRRLGLWILPAVLLILVIGTAVYAGDYYHADPSVQALLTGEIPGVTVEQENGRINFIPDHPQAGLIFYPGGKVEYTAYAPLMAALSQEGILCVLLKMPLNLAVLGMGRAAGIPEEYPQIEDWILAGHSLGGAMAASYLGKHADGFDALVLLAAYSAADLSESGLAVLSIYGSEDGVLNRDKYNGYKKNLPADTGEIVIDGGCHAYFGAYGAQKGDGEPAITREEQIAQTARAIAARLP
ncbi:MAG: alpha/beta hydrolase [Lachnospiraceae bacterium]|nr:alpha/beta hydrolase [Lachnospiraceae bacterium]